MAGPSEAGAPRAGSSTCYVTGGGALEICRSSNEAEGVYAVPPPCRFVHDVQILRLKDTGPPGPLQVIYRAEPPRREGRRGEENCPADLRATDATAGGAVRIGRQVEALATTLPLADPRFWNEGRAGAGPGAARAAQAASPRRRSRASRQARREARRAEREAGERGKMTFQPQNVAPENDPSGSAMMVAGRDWAGDPYYAILTTATEPAPEGHRRVLVQARTYDFQGLDLRVESDPGTEWKPFGAPPEAEGRRRGRGRPEAQKPAPVLDETGKPVVGNCAAPGLEARGLTGSIAMVDRTYHYFYTDVLPSDCSAAPAKRRMGLYLRTSRDPLAERAWSAPVTLIEGLPADTTMRVAKARGMDRWAVAYSCARPVTASGGPVADICLHYTADLSPGSITALSLYAEPVAAGHSSAYLGLRSGGDALGRFTRDGFGWMTDRYGNLDAPAIYPDKGGFLTWLDRRAPRVDGSDASSLYGRPVFWATWTVQPRPAAP